MFIASTSQRAIVYFLREFQPDKTAFLWMLSSGTLGPDASWDSRIKRLGPNARLILDRSTWRLRVERENIDFDPLDLPIEEHQARLENALKDTFDRFQPDSRKWVFLLSGGYDSRGVLLMLENRRAFKYITWGLKSSLGDKENDAYLATSLAEHFDLDHEYFVTDMSSDEPAETVLRRFLVAAEGRVDHISGYTDGMKIWKWMFEAGYAGVIRSDQVFGWMPMRTASTFDLRESIGAAMFSDYHNLRSPAEAGLGNLGTQPRPSCFQIREEESVAVWRDRLDQEYRMPNTQAALNELKCAYVEVANPLLSRRVIKLVRQMPDHLRSGKSLWKKVVSSLSPEIDFAKYRAIPRPGDILKQERQIVDLLANELGTTHTRQLLSDEFVDNVLRNLTTADAPPRKPSYLKTARKLIQYSTPRSLETVLRNTLLRKDLDYNRLAFRAYIICQMHKILSADAQAF